MITLVIGGTRSGKSDVAGHVAAALGEPVTVVVPTVVADESFAQRVRAHQARRPDSWPTVECGPALPDAVGTASGTVLVDSLGSWVAATDGFVVDTTALLDALRRRPDPTVLVTEEVGLSVHAPTEAGRRFTDQLGELNAAVAAAADQVLLVVAGRVTRLERFDPSRGAP
ncbi:MAG TPA: bifunctional adenosylcobinamide kinase/adenosylcobinamide-phosphate guanylyltransferase [Acidimicrobiia bacterium]|nr:bifunctional adenosylcobinamide kinase/adenosylcobinamide-phosphate guanylyltransferase [Acidimicrobiia bacterium]